MNVLGTTSSKISYELKHNNGGLIDNVEFEFIRLFLLLSRFF